jgi:hypothetical protein
MRYVVMKTRSSAIQIVMKEWVLKVKNERLRKILAKMASAIERSVEL